MATSPGSQVSVDPLTTSYRLAPWETAPGSRQFPPVLVSVPRSWNLDRGWALNSGDDNGIHVGLMLWDVLKIYRDPCHWQGTLFDPGPTAADLATALAAVPTRNASQPTDISVDGYSGKYVEWSVPSNMPFQSDGLPSSQAGCDRDTDGPAFQSWTSQGWNDDRYQQGPGQVDKLWILDINGQRLVLDATYMPVATPR